MASSQTERASGSAGVLDEPSSLRCKKCRRHVLDSTSLLTISEGGSAACTVWHVDVEALPDWILTLINQVHWTSGKLNCQHCGSRLGGFNFINFSKCSCGHNTSVHLSKSRVDQSVKTRVCLRRPGTARGPAGFKRTDLTAPEDPGRDSHTTGVPRNSEHELNRETQEPHVTWEWNLISPRSFVLHSSSVDEDLNDGLDSGGEPQSHFSDVYHNSAHREDSRSSQDALVVQEHISGDATEEREHSASFGPAQTLTKREKNRLKSLRRKQRKKERWIQTQRQEEELSVQWNVMSRDDEQKEGFTCAVCLDLYYKPYMCQPCSHVFCEPCLRTLARNRISSTLCPLCRTRISNVLFQKELHQRISAFFPREYRSRKETFQKTNYSKWPLPSCPMHLRILWGLQRRGASAGGWQFALRALGLDGRDALERQVWTFHSDRISFIFSFHWLLSVFIIFCCLLYVLLF